MKWSRILFALALWTVLEAPMHGGERLPKSIAAAPCRKPPVIDGKIGDGEWSEARAIPFEMAFVAVKPQRLGSRPCFLRVMNSANGLYVALSVPDETVNKSFNPLDFDLAMLAFCRGTELAAGDDRKAVGPGIYVDKHFVRPGQDADDKQQDGRAALAHDAGTCAIEWAIPLKSGDAEDLSAKPGDSIRFDVTYFDAFQADLKETWIGTAFPTGLDSASGWGTIELAANVVEDDLSAFQGPAWVRQLIESQRTFPANRLKFVESAFLPGSRGKVVKAHVEYPYRDPRGKAVVGKAKLYLPESIRETGAKVPLYHAAGYELDDASAVAHVDRGYVVVTPRALEAIPIVRTVNPDAALLHIARALPFVDDARVVIAGGSAGGYQTLMLAAETFPVAAAAPDVPPVNWGYNAAFFLQKERNGKQGAPAGESRKTSVFDSLVPIVQLGESVFGTDQSGDVYYRNSPLAHFETITCPVSAYWTTADMLVPIDQVGTEWVRPFDSEKFPEAFTFDPMKLTSTPSGRTRVVDVLSKDEFEVVVVSEETIKERLAELAATKQASEIPFSSDKRWSITILDEGAPEPQVGHMKYPVPWSQRKFLDTRSAEKIAVSQLTLRKLERLMDRYAGKEWLPAGELFHLDDPEVERADVLRGLRTYCAVSPEHARQFAELYAKLSVDRQVLPADDVARLSSGK